MWLSSMGVRGCEVEIKLRGAKPTVNWLQGKIEVLVHLDSHKKTALCLILSASNICAEMFTARKVCVDNAIEQSNEG